MSAGTAGGPRLPFGRRRGAPAAAPTPTAARYGFEYLGADDVYLDSACQTLRPQPVIDALRDHYLTYNACGERVRYPWGEKVDEAVADARAGVLAALGLSARRYATSFTLNTTYGINLLLHQFPAGRHRRIVTTHTEHNSVFLPTAALARREGIERVLVDRAPDGSLDLTGVDLTDALVVVSAMNNVDGAPTAGLAELVAETRRRGGTTIIDAAQAFPHAPHLVRGLAADAICFSAHKVYGPSLGVVAATRELLTSLDVAFVGGGQVSEVTAAGYELLPEPHTRLEPGLQAWGEIIGLRAALAWLAGYEKATGEAPEAREERLSRRLAEGLAELPNLTLRSAPGSSLVTVAPTRVDGHRLAGFLAKAGIMVRSGYFCAHHWLIEREGLDPLVRFSLGAHTTDEDVARTLDVMGRLMKGL